ncbi:hypothetical protein HNR46_003507 [Haloferula luteola]|uniref:Transmembrane protein n=1 Tax=Haloferula luteola TaxID=595692 RepID=A0A840V5K9_9BACT|nr:hypothetical protein [Haloferula luteola]
MTKPIFWWSALCCFAVAYCSISCALYLYRAGFIGMSEPPWWHTTIITGPALLIDDVCSVVESLPFFKQYSRYESLERWGLWLYLTLSTLSLTVWAVGVAFLRVFRRTRMKERRRD